ncbi:alpha/beta fold hydrolase [Echinicola vietnamensis]|uniref:Putative hydrolase or acyltransferase of alpha/beta superfamily n=1 Tax=Echinicola vietnamensis (strain DSM 17526 / LMG 23754 / KMM 6221) TaxID=926556 RepID=L0FX87_ECHVK|nr:alpha/beta hydrolase [Echinicola vietnamensis]AGA77270.1 putative hydrolase or acyltransferase of alpha/beta superfamily [Echinicola vietnamensis DSM 17526]
MTTTIEYTDQGHGKPVIFIHGFCQTKEMWKKFIEVFSGRYRVLCPDLPGFGESRWYEESISLEQTAEMLRDWIDTLGLEKPVVIGHSLGGYVALALAELMGEKLGGLGLFHSTAFADDEEKVGVRNRTLTFVQKHGVKVFVDSFVPPLFTEAHRESMKPIIREVVQIAHKTTFEGLVSFTKAMRDRKDRMDVLRDFKGKKLMIAGVLDGAVTIEASRKHQGYVDHYHELPDAGHMGMFEQPAETVEMISDFLAI